VTRPGLSDVLPGGMCLSADLSVCGGGESVSTRAEVVGDSAERDQKTWQHRRPRSVAATSRCRQFARCTWSW